MRYTARWSFLFFWLSYVGGAMAILFGQAFAGLARRARALGLAFATALQVHIGLVVWLGVVIGQIPLQGGILLFFLAGLFCTYLLVLLSFGVGSRNLGRLWRPLLLLATTYILIAFGRDFLLDAPGQLTQHWLSFVEYVPFALSSLIASRCALPRFFASASNRRRFRRSRRNEHWLIVEQSQILSRRGMLSTPTKADVKPPTQADLVRLTGLEVLARLPVEIMRAERRAGRNTAGFISGYEGSPLGGYDMELDRHRALLDEYGIVFQPGVNEELAATAVQGSQLASASQECTVDGVIGFWYGKSPGLDRASDAFRHNVLMGVPANGGALVFVGDDASAKSSTVPGASERLLADLGIPTLYPADPQQILDLGLHAAAMSRASGLWVALKISTDVANGSMTVDVAPGRVIPVGPVRAVDHAVTAKMMQPMLGVLERSRDGERRQAALDYAARNQLDLVTARGALDRIGIIAAGPTFLHVREALRRMGLDDIELAQHGIRLLQLGMIDPIEPHTMNGFASGLQKIIVVEDKRPFIETAVRDLLYGHNKGGPVIVGKRNIEDGPVFPSNSELTADTIAPVLAEILLSHRELPSVREWLDRRQLPKSRLALPLITRSPYFCSGCPHNSSTKAPDGSLVGAGIGCHGLVTLMDEELVGSITGLTQMGGEGAQWIGMSPFVQQSHLIQNLGDGTFHHSGSLAVRAAVAAGSHITYKILYNSAVAMTGGQQPEGALTVKDLARALLAEGVSRIIVTTDDPKRYRRNDLPRGVRCWHRDRLDEAQRTLAATPGVTVIIHDQECATELRRKRKRGTVVQPVQRVMINERVCEGCGDCGAKSNCLSVQPIETEFGRKRRSTNLRAISTSPASKEIVRPS